VTADLAVGLDLVDIAEAERLLTRWGERLLDRVLTAAERAYVLRAREPARHLAARLAAKEAVFKALQSFPDAAGIGWRDIEIERGSEGRPSVRLHGRAARVAELAGVGRIAVSLSHSGTTAGAMVILASGGNPSK
jgi:holo-[acyl-carrier protein] synthase